jgi:hypothetical protein
MQLDCWAVKFDLLGSILGPVFNRINAFSVPGLPFDVVNISGHRGRGNPNSMCVCHGQYRAVFRSDPPFPFKLPISQTKKKRFRSSQ